MFFETLVSKLVKQLIPKIDFKESISILTICSGGQFVGKELRNQLFVFYKTVDYFEFWTNWNDGKASCWKTDFYNKNNASVLIIVDDVVWSGRQFVAVKDWLAERYPSLRIITATLLDLNHLVDISAIDSKNFGVS